MGILGSCFRKTRSSPVGVRNARLEMARVLSSRHMGIHFVRKRSCKFRTFFGNSTIRFISKRDLRYLRNTGIGAMRHLSRCRVVLALSHSIYTSIETYRGISIRGVA